MRRGSVSAKTLVRSITMGTFYPTLTWAARNIPLPRSTTRRDFSSESSTSARLTLRTGLRKTGTVHALRSCLTTLGTVPIFPRFSTILTVQKYLMPPANAGAVLDLRTVRAQSQIPSGMGRAWTISTRTLSGARTKKLVCPTFGSSFMGDTISTSFAFMRWNTGLMSR